MNGRERAIGIFLLVAIIASGGFIAAYVTDASRLQEGLSLAAATAAFAAAALGCAFWMVSDEQVVDEIEAYPSPAAERVLQSTEIREDTQVLGRRRALVRLLYGALGIFGLALVVPIRSLGPDPGTTLFHTKWRKGDRLARIDGSFVRVTDMNVGSDEVIFPEGAVGDAMSQAVLIRLPTGIVASTPDGYIAYSRVCTHAGCPVALYRAQAQQLLCPCHQSVFNVVRDGAVLSGPADQALPRLAIVADADGTLRAAGDFSEPVGPGFWERP